MLARLTALSKRERLSICILILRHWVYKEHFMTVLPKDTGRIPGPVSGNSDLGAAGWAAIDWITAT